MASISINTTNVFLNGFVIETDTLLNGYNYYLTISENGIDKTTERIYTVSNINNATSIIDSWINIGFVPSIDSNICFQLSDTSGSCPPILCTLEVT